MLTFNKHTDHLVLSYESRSSAGWVFTNIHAYNSVTLAGVFTFEAQDLLNMDPQPEIIDEDGDVLDDLGGVEDHSSAEFRLAIRVGDYYKIDKRILNTKIDVFFHNDIDPSERMFIAEKGISIFKKISEVLSEDLYIGGLKTNSLPFPEFERLLKAFPNFYELQRYTDARIAVVLRDFFDNVKDGVSRYEKYMNKKVSIKGANLLAEFQDSEIAKYQAIIAKLETMLRGEDKYTEKQWQIEIVQIVQLLFPKYIRVFTEAPVRDPYADTMRSLDFMLVDSNGHIDIVEIKRPKGNNIVSQTLYRDNYIPVRELSGSVMQIEKYIYYLNKWGTKGEQYLTKKYSNELPSGLSLKIINPGGIVIMGRETSLSEKQKHDLEIIKRKYKSIIDVLTYDELIARTKMMINKFDINPSLST